jgi:hypothetical protein
VCYNAKLLDKGDIGVFYENESNQYSFDSLWFSNNCRKSLGTGYKLFDLAVTTICRAAIPNRWNHHSRHSEEQGYKAINHNLHVSGF